MVANAEDGAVFYRLCGMRDGGGGEGASAEPGQRVSWVQQGAPQTEGEEPACCLLIVCPEI